MSILNQILPEDWAKLLKDQEELLLKIGKQVAERRQTTNVFPKSDEVFKAFWMCPLDKLRVIWIGMD
jgi:uracil DNA glycosylase